MSGHQLLEAQNFELAGETVDNINQAGEQTIKISILEQLINIPVADSTVLKDCYEFLIHRPGNMETFLKSWTKVYGHLKAKECERICHHFYDKASTSAFEDFANQQDNFKEALSKLQIVIDQLHDDYIKSNYLKISSLEKLLSLIIAKDIMPINFYIVFNYACSKKGLSTDLKSEMLNAVFDLHLIGYDQVLDYKLMADFY